MENEPTFESPFIPKTNYNVTELINWSKSIERKLMSPSPQQFRTLFHPNLWFSLWTVESNYRLNAMH
jgi:hypothetical protein